MRFYAAVLCVLVDVFKVFWFFQCSLVHFSPDLSLTALEKIPQSAGKGFRKAHVILGIFMQLGSGHCVVLWTCYGPAPETLTLFWKDRNHTIFDTLLKKFTQKTISSLRHLPKKRCPIYDKVIKIDTLFKTKIQKTIRWLAARPHLALIRSNPSGNPCNVKAFHPEGLEMLLDAQCHGNRDNLRPDGQ